MNKSHVQRIDHIDSIRGIAALLVVFIHTADAFNKIPAVSAQGALLYEIAFQLDIGRAGVVAFFAISGFVICPTLKGQRFDGARKFLISRFFRLYPAFWTAIILALMVKYVWPGNAIDWQQVLGNIPILYSAFNVAPLQGLYWTLEVELIFYFLCLLLFLTNCLHRPQVLCALGIVLMVISQWIFSQPQVKSAITDALSIHWVFMFWNLAIMFWGGLFRIWYDDRESTCFIGTRSVSVSILVGALFLAIMWKPLILTTTWLIQGKLWALHEMMSYFMGMGLFIGGALFLRMNNRFLVWLGTISYSVYLLHPIAFRAVILLINTHFPQWGNFHMGVYLALCTALSIGMASIVYQYIEKPTISLGRRLQRRQRSRDRSP